MFSINSTESYKVSGVLLLLFLSYLTRVHLEIDETIKLTFTFAFTVVFLFNIFLFLVNFKVKISIFSGNMRLRALRRDNAAYFLSPKTTEWYLASLTFPESLLYIYHKRKIVTQNEQNIKLTLYRLYMLKQDKCLEILFKVPNLTLFMILCLFQSNHLEVQVSSMLHHGSVWLVHSKEWYFIFIYTFLAFFGYFSSKNLCFYHFHFFF